MRKYLREQRRNKMSLLEKFDEELKDIQNITEEQVKEKLEVLLAEAGKKRKDNVKIKLKHLDVISNLPFIVIIPPY